MFEFARAEPAAILAAAVFLGLLIGGLSALLADRLLAPEHKQIGAFLPTRDAGTRLSRTGLLVVGLISAAAATAALYPAIGGGHVFEVLALVVLLIALLSSAWFDFWTRLVDLFVIIPAIVAVTLLRMLDGALTKGPLFAGEPLLTSGAFRDQAQASALSPIVGILVLGAITFVIWYLPGRAMAHFRAEIDPDTGEQVEYAGLGDIWIWLLVGAALGPIEGVIALVLGVFINGLISLALIVLSAVRRDAPFGHLYAMAPGIVAGVILVLAGVVGR